MTRNQPGATPRTDAAKGSDSWSGVSITFARQLERELSAAQAEIETLRVDAKRYQHLRDFYALQVLLIVFDIEAGCNPDEELDAAIDAALKEKP